MSFCTLIQISVTPQPKQYPWAQASATRLQSRLILSNTATILSAQDGSQILDAYVSEHLWRWSKMFHHNCDPHLTHWGRLTHTCIGKQTTIGSDNGLSPERCQAIICTNARILSIRPLATNFSEILSEIHSFSFWKMHLKMSSAKWRPFCFGLNVLSVFKGNH